jgi:integrase
LRRLREAGPGRATKDVVEEIVCMAGSKWSYRLNVWIVIRGILLDSGQRKEGWWKNLEQRIHHQLLWEDPKKAERLTPSQLSVLATEKNQRFAVANALILPSGMRFADAAKIRNLDIQIRGQAAMIRIRQSKTIRQRRHQRWLSLLIPRTLLKAVCSRLQKGRPEDFLIQVQYPEYLQYLKRTLGSQYTTYSVRRSVLNLMAQRVRSIEELQKTTLHRTTDQLRWYLDEPLPDEADAQIHATSWHVHM